MENINEKIDKLTKEIEIINICIDEKIILLNKIKGELKKEKLIENINKIKKKLEIKIENLNKLNNKKSDINLKINNKKIIKNPEIEIKASYNPIFKILNLDNTNNIITNIIHIADIHIKFDKQHNEYREVFNKFYDDLTNHKNINKDTIICICGDILDTKYIYNTNVLLLAREFIKNLSLIFPVFIIAGNHDIIETNNEKKCSISAILDLDLTNNIYYLLNSGVYIYNNIIFSVSSLIDNYILHIEETNKILNINNYISNNNTRKICLYHGYFNGISINGDIKLKGRSIKLSDLGNYDFILLGDIHKFQYLNEKKTIAYPSSLISHNFSETDDDHGYIKWNIIDGTSEFIRLNNDNAYHKININDLLDKNNEIKIDYLDRYKSGYLRIDLSDKSDKYNITEIIEKVNKIYPKFIITYSVYNNEKISIINSIEQKIDKFNLEEEIFNYIKQTYSDLEDNIITELIKYLTDKNIYENKKQNIGYVDSNWKLIYLKFDNMYGYGENNVIDFSLYPNREIIGIFGENTYGKSSLIDIIIYMLYSIDPHYNRLPLDIINIHKENARGYIIIQSENKYYLILRQCFRITKKAGNTDKIRHELYLYELIEYNKEIHVQYNKTSIFEFNNKLYTISNLTNTERRTTNDILTRIVGSYDYFSLTSVLFQGLDSSFKSKNQIDQKKFLCNILNINYMTELEPFILGQYKKVECDINKIYNELCILLEIKPNKKLQYSNEKKIILDNELILFNEKLCSIIITIKIVEDKLNYQNKLKDDMKFIEYQNNNKFIISNDEDLKKFNNIYIDLVIELETIKNEISKNEISINNITYNEIIYNELHDELNTLFIIKHNKERIDELNKLIDETQFEDPINLIEKKNNIKKTLKIIDYSKKSFNNNDILEYLIQLKYNKEKLISLFTETIDFFTNNNNKYINQEEYNEYFDEKKILLDLLNNQEEKEIIFNLFDYDEKQKLLNIYSDYENLLQKYNRFSDNDKIIIFFIFYNNNKKLLNYFIGNTYEIINELNIKKQIINNNNRLNDEINKIIIDDVNNYIIDDVNNKIILEYKNYVDNNVDYILNLEINDKKLIIDKLYEIKNYDIIKIQDEYDNKKKLLYYKEYLENQIDKSIDVKLVEDELQILENKIFFELKINERLNIITDIDMIQDNISNYINININRIKEKEIELLEFNINRINEQNKNKNFYKSEIIKIKQSIDISKYEYNIIEIKQNEIIQMNKNRDFIINTKDIIINYKNKLFEIENNIRELKNSIENYDKFKIYKTKELELININLEISKLKDNLKYLNIEKEEIIINLNKNNLLVNNINNNLIKFNELLKELNFFKILKEICSKDGLQLFILKKYVDKISNKINNILEPFINKKINILIDNKNDIYIEIKSGSQIINKISGMESLMLDLSFKIIISIISNVPKSRCIFIDESLSVLDKERMNNIDDFFDFLKRHYNHVYVITHMIQIKNYIEHNIDIIKKNNFSKIYNIIDNLTELNLEKIVKGMKKKEID